MICRFLNKKPGLIILSISSLLFLIILPLVLKINYVQNDEWAFFPIIQNFLRGNYQLTPLCAPTFYSIGFLATLFSIIFGVSKLPVLTLLVSVANFALFSLIIYEFYGRSVIKSFLLSAFLFFNPLFVYSGLGFMTENYLITALLASLYFYIKYHESNNPKHLALFFILSFIAFMTKQAALALPLSILIFSIFTNKRKDAVKTAIFLAIIVGFYIFIFPRTPAMTQKGLLFTHFLKRGYTYAMVYGIILMLTSFTLPLVFLFIIKQLKGIKIKSLMLTGILTITLFFGLNKLFIPMVISWEEFPYFENTFERGGLYPRNIDGTKYLYRFNYDLYKYWDLSAKVLLAALLAVGIFKAATRPKIKQFLPEQNLNLLYVIFIEVYLALMVVAETLYDRYYFLLIIPFVLLIIDSKPLMRKETTVVGAFVVFLVFLAYQFSMDFVLLNRTVWMRAEQLSKQYSIEKKYIKGTKGWRHTYRPGLGALPYTYVFSYDPTPPESFTTLPPIETEEIEINFPFSIWVNPKIYLLKYQ